MVRNHKMEFFINFRAGVLPPLPVQNVMSKHMLSDICYPKAYAFRCEGVFFQILNVEAIFKAAHVDMHGLFSKKTACGAVPYLTAAE